MMSFSEDGNDDDSIDVADLLANRPASTVEGEEANHNGICGSKLSLYSSRRSSASFYAPTLFDSTYTLSELDRIDGLNASSTSLPRRRASLANSCPDFEDYEASSVDARTSEMEIPMVITLARERPPGASALRILEFSQRSLNDLPVADPKLDQTQKGSCAPTLGDEASHHEKQGRRR